MSVISIASGNTINLRRLIWLRLIVLFSELVAATIVVRFWKIELPMSALVTIWVAVVLVSVLTFIRLRYDRPVTDGELFFQLTLEVLALTAVLYFSGGSTNPFAPFYLLPLTLTAAALPGSYVWGMMLLTVSCYTGLLFFNIPLPAVHGGHGGDFRLHEMGMWFGFLLSASLIAGFAVRMVATMRQRDQMIAEMHEQQLRQERVLALGTLAAGAAHELGTPLSTMAVLLKDMAADEPVKNTTLETMRSQVDRCKSILGSISAAAGEVRAESGSAQPLDTYLDNLLQRWQAQRPDVVLSKKIERAIDAPRIVIDQTLEQAILNILNNAADASPQNVDFTAHWTDTQLAIEIADRGPGLAPEVADQAGQMIHSTKQDGLGLGLFLSYNTLQRLGGEVQLLNRVDGGTVCRIKLPVKPLTITEQNV
jgi:two-component system sensor histidine kinase RegB